MNTHVQTRIRQPLGLIEVIDRNPQAVEQYPDTTFLRDHHGLLQRTDGGAMGEEVKGGVYSLFTRIWLGLAPPTGREPGYGAVVGEVYETGLPRGEALQARLRPVFLLDECHDFLMPRLLRSVTNLKDIWCPYLDRADLAEERRRHDPYYQILVWPQDELLEDVNRPHHGLSCYPYEEDLSDSQCKQRWPHFCSRNHVVGAVFPPYKEDPERLHAVVDALQAEKTDTGLEMFGVHHLCKAWSEGQWKTPHMAVSMVCAAFQRWDWAERVNPDAISDGYPTPTIEEDEEAYYEALLADEEGEAVLYSCLGAYDRSVLEAGGMDAYRRLIGVEARRAPWEGRERASADDEQPEETRWIVPM